MKYYLLKLQENVADEDDVSLIKLFTEDEKKEYENGYYSTGFGNLEGENFKLTPKKFKEISKEHYQILKKYDLDGFGGGIQIYTEQEKIDDEPYFSKR
jgi:hypothetical protein